MKRLLLFFILVNLIIAGDVPTDSIMQNDSIPAIRKLVILPINFWQHISFSSNAMNCQFEPSCSQFTAIAIANHGVFPGAIMGADRIIRCNPAAYHYHTLLGSGEFFVDGRLLDQVPSEIKMQPLDMRLMYNFIPGLSRATDGRPVDGFYSFLLTATCVYAGYHFYSENKNISATFFAAVGLTFWLSDFYNYFQKH